MPGMTPEAGAEQSFMTTAPHLLALGYDLHLALLTPLQTLVPALEALGVTIHDLSSRRTLVGRARAVRRVVAAVKPDVVHAVLFEATVPTQLGLVGQGTPILITWANTHQLDPSVSDEGGGARWKIQLGAWLERLLGRLTPTRYHAVTHGTAASYRSLLRVDEDRVRVAERGRELDRLAEANADRVEKLRAELGLDPSNQVLLAVGRQEPQKGLDVLLDIVDQLADERENLRVLIAGRPGRSTAALQVQHRSMRHGDQVRFLGHRDDVPDLLHLADLVVCTSRREGAAGALLEAMAAGRAIVSLPLRGLDGVLTDGVDAVLADRSAMPGAIGRLLDDPEHRASLGAAASAAFVRRFTADRSAAAMCDVYEWAARPD